MKNTFFKRTYFCTQLHTGALKDFIWYTASYLWQTDVLRFLTNALYDVPNFFGLPHGGYAKVKHSLQIWSIFGPKWYIFAHNKPSRWMKLPLFWKKFEIWNQNYSIQTFHCFDKHFAQYKPSRWMKVQKSFFFHINHFYFLECTFFFH